MKLCELVTDDAGGKRKRGTDLRAAKIRYKRGMSDSTKRSIVRWIHIIFGIPIAGYVYSPFSELPNYAPVVRFVALPAIVLTGLWMWKGHVVRRLLGGRSG